MPGNADDEVGEGVSTEMADRQHRAEALADDGDPGHPLAVLVDPLGPSGVETTVGTGHDHHCAGGPAGADAMTGDPDGQVVTAVEVEIAGSERSPEGRVGPRPSRDAGRVGVDRSSPTEREAAGSTGNDRDCAGAAFASVLARGPDGQVVEAVAVEVTGGERSAEAIPARRRAGTEIVFGEGRRAGARRTARRASDDPDRTGGSRSVRDSVGAPMTRSSKPSPSKSPHASDRPNPSPTSESPSMPGHSWVMRAAVTGRRFVQSG